MSKYMKYGGGALHAQGKQKVSNRAPRVRDLDTQIFSYEELLMSFSFRKRLGNGNWTKLNYLEEALSRVSCWYVKNRGSINK